MSSRRENHRAAKLRANGHDAGSDFTPHSIEAEQAVLGIAQRDVKCIPPPASDFFRRDHRLLAEEVHALIREGHAPEPFALAERLRDKGQLDEAGTLAYIAKLAREAPAIANFRVYADAVREKAAQRRYLDLVRLFPQALANGATSEQLGAALRSTLDQVPIDSGRDSLRLLTLEDYEQRPACVMLVSDLLPEQSICIVFGAPKSGKTYVVTDLVMHAAHGIEHWHGHRIARPLRIAYLAGEGHAGLRVRLLGWRQHHGAELRGDYRVLAQALPLVERIDEVLALLRDYAPDIVVLDTANAYFGGADENSTQDMTSFVAALRRLRDELRCSVIVIHHTGLGDQTRERGSSVLRGAADVIVQVARDDSGSGLIGVQMGPARDMESWEEPLSLRLTPITLDDWADDEGDAVRTCIVSAGDGAVTLPGRGGAKPLGEAQSALLSVIHDLARAAPTSRPGEEIMLARPDVSAAAQKQDLDRRRVSQSWTSLANRRLIRLVEPGGVIVRVPR